jgi:hypothetical protein
MLPQIYRLKAEMSSQVPYLLVRAENCYGCLAAVFIFHPEAVYTIDA